MPMYKNGKKPPMPGDPGYVNPKFGGAPTRNKNKGVITTQPIGKPKPVKKMKKGK